MPRWSKLVLAVLVPVVIVAGIWLFLYRPGPPDLAQTAVRMYVEYRSGIPVGAFGPAPQYTHATRPGGFKSEMSRASYGSGLYYETDFDYAAPKEPVAWATNTAGQAVYTSTYAGANHGARRLPTTVNDAWCVQVGDIDPMLPKVVLVAEHQDLYNADWIVHEPVAQTADELNQWLADVGCNLVLTQ